MVLRLTAAATRKPSATARAAYGVQKKTAAATSIQYLMSRLLQVTAFSSAPWQYAMTSRRGAFPSLTRAGGNLRRAASRERSSTRRVATAICEAAEIHSRGTNRSRPKQGVGTRSSSRAVEPHSGSPTAGVRRHSVGKRRLCASSPTRSFSDELLSSPTHARRRSLSAPPSSSC